MKIILMPYKKEIPIVIEEFRTENGRFIFRGRLEDNADFAFHRVQKHGTENVFDLELHVGKWLSLDDMIRDLGTEKAAEEMGLEEADILNYLTSVDEAKDILDDKNL